MIAFGPVLTAALVDFIWQGALIAAALWIVLALLARRSAHARYLAATAAMAMLAAAPIVTALRLYSQPATVLVYPGAVSRITAVAETTIGKGTAGWLPHNWLLEAWAIGVLLFSLRLIWSGAQVHRLRRAGTSAETSIVLAASELAERLRLTRTVRVLVSTMAEVPSVVGWLRPTILLPAATLTGLTPEQLETVLAHELAHIRRHDYAINLLQVLIETLLFYHPAVWWVSGRIRRERELCCDDIVVAACGDALCYARALTTLERLRGVPPALALGSTGGPLSFRVKRLVSGAAVERHAPSRMAAVAALTLGLVCFSLSLNWTRVKAQSNNLTVPSTDSGVAVDTNGAALIHRTPVEYPRALSEKMIGGVMTVEATLDERGVVSDARVVSGPSELRKYALTSVLNWHFMPAGAGATRTITITFSPQLQTMKPAEIGVSHGDPNVAVRVFLKDEVQAAKERVNRLQAAPSADAADLAKAEAHLADLTSKAAAADTAGPIIATTVLYHGEVGKFLVRPAGADQVNLQPPPVIDRVEAGGLSDEVTQQLLARLPAHAGDLLTPERLTAIRQAAQQFDEHFRVAVVPIPDKGAAVVALRIDLEQ